MLYNATAVLVVDPRTQTVSFIEGVGEGGLKYAGICMASEGVLICAPGDASSVMQVLPFSEKLIWDRVATAGGSNFEVLMRSVFGRSV